MLPRDIVSRSKDTLFTEVDGEAVLMSIASGKYFTLDEVGTVVWSRLEQPVAVAELQQGLLEHFAGDVDVIRAQSTEFLAKLNRLNLIVVTPAE